MDNCYRECKNRYILGFCALLVKKGIFKEVRLFPQKTQDYQARSLYFLLSLSVKETQYCILNWGDYIRNLQVQLSFLMVGHTHEDVDQVIKVTLVS